MAQIIEMPKLSDTMEEGAIASWLKKEGEFIEEGEAFVEIETDKATMEYNSPEEGYLLKILVGDGESCDLNQPICVVGEKGESFDLDKLASSAGKSSEKASEPAEEAPAAAVAPAAPAASAQGDRVKASPLAKKTAQDKGVDLAGVTGTGPLGRIIQRDVNAVSAAPVAAAASSAPAAAPIPAGVMSAGDRDMPNSMMRKTIAKRLLAGKNDAPAFLSFSFCKHD